MTTESPSMTVNADTRPYQRALGETARLLESGNVFVLLPESLRNRLKLAADGVGTEELIELVRVPATDAGELRLEVRPGRLLHELCGALRALGFEIDIGVHGEPRCEG